nr:GGDEF domain-containing protein [Roseateles oligotrophus]
MASRASFTLACGLLLALAGLPAQATESGLMADQQAPALAELRADAAADPKLDARLAPLLRRAYDRPDEALLGLRQLQADPANAEYQLLLRWVEARIAVQAADFATAERLGNSLAGAPLFSHRLDLLRAELADRKGQPQPAAQLAQRAVDGLEKNCVRSQLRASIAKGCDFRSIWYALRVLERKQRNEGALPLAEATARYGLELAEAGADAYMSAISMGSLALLAHAQDQGEASRRWLVQALQTAQGDAQAMAQVKVYESTLASHRGDLPTRLQALEDGLAFAEQAGAERLIVQIRANQVDTLLRQGRAGRAVEVALEALPLALQRHDLRIERTLRHNLSVAYVQLGQQEKVRREVARLDELRLGQPDQNLRMLELRELGEAMAEAGWAKEAMAIYHEERKLSAQVNARNREAALQQLQLKYDSERKQRDLELLARDNSLKDQQLGNRQLLKQVVVAVAALLLLSLALSAVMVRRVRAANRRLKANEALLRAQSERDPLTDLANRRHFLAVMEQQAQRGFQGALLMIDIDHFKHVNDEYGHAVGDIVICEVARRISHAVRQQDLVVRWGGEEFLVFSAGVSPEQLGQLAERVLMCIGEAPVQSSGGPLRVTASIGFAHFPLPPTQQPLHWEQAVNWADKALYMAKAKGRNRALGIAAVQAQDGAALQQIEADFELACSSGRVHLREVLGPP